MGAFPTHAPTNSQLAALKHAQSEPVTAVQNPPGSGENYPHPSCYRSTSSQPRTQIN